ncbi:hypothetical protein Oweho_1187 [Owenweeksia hongkongensis DSM 17368]|uniref:Uncharacterized protein n=1 Tax=Owenweeksia hongkongensis (strain DSM 17368 / CIP 108786 / JCM 12287 / NRRL B-23963 / UST20020801) TaxID=926562 RepID=G8R602_OWEHD|nr:hypothetical protein [Owenweeksia hongkongensis]AEV32192.1 hypothetical protein Oweho_1187 [Owenweeksia hongkongensis DSM 17368]
MRALITLGLLLLCKLSLAGIHITFSDYIIFGGDTLTLSNRPLDSYFDLYPELMPIPEEPFTHANNQYTAVFEIKDSSLYLTAIYTDKTDTDNTNGRKNLISEVFEGQKEVRMNWFSTSLVFGTSSLGRSKRIYGNQRNEKFYLALINDGKVSSIKESKAKKIKRLRHRLFKEFSKTPQYIALENTGFGPDSDLKPKEIEKYLQNKIFDYTSQTKKEKTTR